MIFVQEISVKKIEFFTKGFRKSLSKKHSER